MLGHIEVMRFLDSVSRLLARRCSIPTHAEGPAVGANAAMKEKVVKAIDGADQLTDICRVQTLALACAFPISATTGTRYSA